MQIGLVVDPRVFSAAALRDKHSRNEAELLMGAVRQNALLLAGSRTALVNDMKSSVEQLDTRLGQQLQIRIEELAKDAKRCIATWPPLGKVTRTWDYAYIRQLAKDFGADAIVCQTCDDMVVLRDLEQEGIEVVEIGDYSHSATENRRQRYREAVRLDDIEDVTVRDDVVGRAIKYARRISLIDPHIASRASQGRPEGYVRAIAYVAELWQRFSPYVAEGRLDLELITAGGQRGAAGSVIDAATACGVLETAVRRRDRQQIIGALQITVKQDSTPRIFCDRFLEAKRRCWGVRHSIDCLGDLTGSSSKRRPTFIDPASDDNLALVMQLRDLPDA